MLLYTPPPLVPAYRISELAVTITSAPICLKIVELNRFAEEGSPTFFNPSLNIQ